MTQQPPIFPQAVVLGDGSVGQIRPLAPSDRDALVAGFNSLSSESRIRRFLFEKKALSEAELHHLTHPDGVDHLALVLEVRKASCPDWQPIAVARCFRDPQDRSLGEVAFVTLDDWHGVGVGTALVHALSAAAWSIGIRRWRAALLSHNRTTRNLLSRVGVLGEELAVGSGVVELVCYLRAPS